MQFPHGALHCAGLGAELGVALSWFIHPREGFPSVLLLMG